MNKILAITAILTAAIFASGVLATNYNTPQQVFGTASVACTQSSGQCSGDTPICMVSPGSLGPFATVEQLPGTSGNWAHGTITVQDLGPAYKWTFTITDTNLAGHVYGVGLQISEDNVLPAFQVYYKENGVEADQTWHYQQWTGTGWNGWGGVDTIILPSGITVTGTATGQTFTITIAKSLFTAAPYWAAQLRTNLLGVYPAGFSWGPTYVFQPIQANCVPATCGVSATGPIAFGPLTPGATVGGDLSRISTVTNNGNVPTTEFWIGGTGWMGVTNSNSNTMPVGATSWSVGSGWNTMTSNTLTSANINPGSPLTTYFELAVPLNQPADNYQQTITFTSGC